MSIKGIFMAAALIAGMAAPAFYELAMSNTTIASDVAKVQADTQALRDAKREVRELRRADASAEAIDAAKQKAKDAREAIKADTQQLATDVTAFANRPVFAEDVRQ